MYWLALLVFFYILVKLIISLLNLFTAPRLPDKTCDSDTLISVLVPARNEAERIGHLLESIGRQLYRHFEVIVLDDHSEDDTLAIVKRFAMSDQRVKAISGKALPPGWLGKNWACHQLAAEAKGKSLIFLDADVVLQPNFISSSVAVMEQKQYDLLSVFNDQIMKSPGEHTVVPLMHYLLLSILPIAAVQRFKDPSVSAASGQCMIFPAESYRRYLWHLSVKDSVLEDITIMRKLKKRGGKAAAYLANGLIRCRMYHNLQEAVNGFSKNLLAGFNFNMFGLFAYVFMESLCWLVLPFYTPVHLLAIMIILVICSRVIISVLAKQAIWLNILLHPMQMVFLCIIALRSVYTYTTGNNSWKGRKIDLRPY